MIVETYGSFVGLKQAKCQANTLAGVHDRILRRQQTPSTPSLPEARRRRGLGRGGRLDVSSPSLPLSLTLSPFVPHGERGTAKSIWVARYFCLEMPMKLHLRRILSCALWHRSGHPAESPASWQPHPSIPRKDFVTRR